MKLKHAVAAAALAGVSMIGGAVGATLLGTANAATPTPSSPPSPGNGSTPAPQGGWHSNEDPAHEAGESASREAEEDAAQANGTAPGHSGSGYGGAAWSNG